MPTPTGHPEVGEDFRRWVQDMSRRMTAVERRAPHAQGATVTNEGLIERVYDPSTAPTPASAPASTPDITVTGDKVGFTVVIPGGDIAQTTVFDYYVDDALVHSSPTRVLWWPTDSNGQPFVPGVDYTWRIVARNARGSAPASAAVAARLDENVDSVTVLGWVAAGFVLAGQVQVGNITIHPVTGITIPLSNGGVIKLPADGSDAIITAILNARSIVVEDNLRVRGTRNAIEGALLLAFGVSRPTVPADAAASWTHPAAYTQSTADVTYGTTRGLYDTPNGWAFGIGLYGGSVGIMTKGGFYYDHLVDLPYKMNPIGGITRVGASWFLMVRDDNHVTSEWWVREYDADWNYVNKWQMPRQGASPNCTLTSDGNYLWVARATGTGRIEFTKWTTSGVLQPADAVQSVTSTVTASTEIVGAYVGNANLGARRFVAISKTKSYVFNTAGARVTNQEWAAPGGDTMLGLSWDGTRFNTLGITGRIWHHSQVATQHTEQVTYTWYDPVGTVHESPASDATAVVRKPGEWMLVSTPAPNNAGGVDDPKRVRIYIDNQRQPELADAQTESIYDVKLAGPGAPLTPYGGSIPAGSLASVAADDIGPLISLLGDGSWRIGDYRGNPNGETLQSPTKGGWKSVTTGASGTVTEVAVTFDKPFASGIKPWISMMCEVDTPGPMSVSVKDVTNVGFKMRVQRDASSATFNVCWSAGVPG